MAGAAWKQIGVCPDFHCDERLWHAGLSEDGNKCFISGFEDHAYIVWDVHHNQVLWKDDGYDGDSNVPPLEEWIDSDGFINISSGPAEGRYQLFGMEHNNPKTEVASTDLSLELDQSAECVVVRNRTTREVVARLKYEAFSGDWASASFSEDGSTIAVIEPYNVTFFGRERTDAG